jgi:hypothetical protein
VSAILVSETAAQFVSARQRARMCNRSFVHSYFRGV